MLPDHPAGFARAALIEGGFGQYQEWNVAVSERLRAHGGTRVLFVCGRLECAKPARLNQAKTESTVTVSMRSEKRLSLG